jgi:carbamoyltransferase
MDYAKCLAFGGVREAFLRLSDIGYDESAVCERLELEEITDITWRAIPIYRKEKLFAREPLECAIDIFLLQGALSQKELDLLFDEEGQKTLCGCGVLSSRGDRWVSNLSCYPVGGGFIVSDHAWPKLPHPGQRDVPHNQVMYIGTDSRWLAHATVRRELDSALDLCTGSGIHAVLTSRHAKRVVAVDINQRAVECTAFNAYLVGAQNVEAVCGDLYEKLGDERFELITANPPFVPSPVDELGYRDGGNDGESVQRRIVEELPSRLSFGGIAQIVTELGELESELLTDRLRSWLNGAPLDILVLRLRTHSAANYAISHASGDDSYEEFFTSVDEWATNLSSQGYTHISSVLIAFKWSDPSCGEPWERIEDVTPPSADMWYAIEEIFAAERLSRLSNLREVLESRKIRRLGNIGLLEGSQLGNTAGMKAQAQLLGAPLAIGKWLDATELNILLALYAPKSLSELVAEFGGNEELLLDKLRLLIRSGFVTLC